jgi:HEAT repeat protein
LPLAVLIWIVWMAALLEDLYQRRRGIALLLAAGSISLSAYGLFGQYLVRALRAHPERTREYVSSNCADKRYLGLSCFPDLLTADDLAALAKDSSPKVRHAAFVRMGERADPGFLADFREGLNDHVQIVRTKACWGLGEMGGPDALRLLEQVLAADPSWYVREYAYKAIFRIQPVQKKVESM